jgi:hypothetical protein
LDWFDVENLVAWQRLSLQEQRRYHEQFAYSYEIYLSEGTAPGAELQPIFERFSAWLKEVYKSIREDINSIYRQEHGQDLPILTPEIRGVMDRMLAPGPHAVDGRAAFEEAHEDEVAVPRNVLRPG